jgi:hypothetical protein
MSTLGPWPIFLHVYFRPMAHILLCTRSMSASPWSIILILAFTVTRRQERHLRIHPRSVFSPSVPRVCRPAPSALRLPAARQQPSARPRIRHAPVRAVAPLSASSSPCAPVCAVGLRGRPLVDCCRPPVRGSACRGRPVLLPIAASSPCSWCSPRH